MNLKSTFVVIFLCLTVTACGNRFDLSTERGKQARIDETNFYLSINDCNSALNSINPVFEAFPTDPEIMVLRSSVDACFGGFNFINLVINITEKPVIYTALAKTMVNVELNDGELAAMYRASDILTTNNTVLDAVNRSTYVNDFMVFLQLGIAGAILASYGDPDAEGNKGTVLDYQLAQAGTMSDEDACALVAAHAMAIDSFTFSNLGSNTEAQSAVDEFNTACVAATGVNCSDLEKDRSVCDGANGASTNAVSLVGGINAAW